jgi:hypothetical protein
MPPLPCVFFTYWFGSQKSRNLDPADLLNVANRTL